MSISAMVNTCNEEKNIAACLQTLQWVDQLVVVDSGSTDNTVALAQRYAHEVVTIPQGDFAAIRNAGLEHLTGDWVVVVDADERVTPELRAEIQRRIAANPVESGFFIPRRNMFNGHVIVTCGWYPDYVLRLFRNSPHHRFSGRVHERVQLDGATGKLTHPFVHNTYESLEHYLHKFNRYTTLAAEMMYEKGRRTNLLHLLFRPPLEFVSNYVLKGGFRDGIYGLIISYMSSAYIFTKFAKLWLMQRPGRGGSETGERDDR